MTSSHRIWTRRMFDIVDGVLRGALMAAAILAAFSPSRLETARLHVVAPVTSTTAGASAVHRQADFGTEQASSDARAVADWVIRSQDNKQADFVIVDKKAAKLYVFDAMARLRGASTILLGAARGDDTVAGIGQRPISDVRPEERTTPAGRFLAQRGHNGRGEDVVWVDYDAGVSMHRVLTTNASEHRLARLASTAITDKRISYGCINVPVAFFESQLSPVFLKHKAMVYVLPEVKPLGQVFTMAGAHLPS